MIRERIIRGYDDSKDLSCCDRILKAADEAYGFKLSNTNFNEEFAEDIATNDVCGAIKGGSMVIEKLFEGESSDKIERIKGEFESSYKKELGTIECAPLRSKYRTVKNKCYGIVVRAGEVLDDVIKNNEK